MESLVGKTILVTGGTGSFGRALVSRLVADNVDFKEIRIFSRDEWKQEEMRISFSNDKLNGTIDTPAIEIRARSVVPVVVHCKLNYAGMSPPPGNTPHVETDTAGFARRLTLR